MKMPLVGFALSFSIGIFAAVYFLPQNFWLPLAAVVLVIGVAAALLFRSKRAYVLVAMSGVLVSLLWMRGYTHLIYTPVEPLYGTEKTVVLELTEYPEKQDSGARCRVRMEGVTGSMLYYGDDSLLELSPGDTLRGTVSCYSALEVGGSPSTYYLSQKIVLRLYPVGEMKTVRSQQFSLRYLPQELSHALTVAVEELFSEDTRGFILALLTGDRSQMDEQASTDLEEAGLLHLTAVSGLHCGFLVAALTFVVGGNRFVRFAVSYPVLLVYMLMVGCTPSVVRSCVMIGLMLAAPLLDREEDAPTSLGFAALLILLENPYAIASVSFQLSFAAVIGLILVSPRIYQGLRRLYWPEKRRAKRVWFAVITAISASLGALVFTAPLSAWYFHRIALISPLSNFLVLPVMQILFAVSLLLTVLYLWFPGIAVLAPVAEVLTEYVLWVAEICRKVPGHAVVFGGAVMVMWLVLVYAMFLVCFVSKDRGSKYVLAAVLAILTLFAARMLPVWQVKDNTLTAVSVDVGQGAATLLHSEGATALVDCGSYYCERGSGAAVADAMYRYGWESLDYLVLTHYHEDHAGGLDELLARVEVEEFLLPWAKPGEDPLHDEVIALADRYGIAVGYVEEKSVVSLGRAKLTVFPQLTVGQDNEEGLSVLCSVGTFDLLITGDMGAATERLLLEKYSIPEVEVLLVGHHGSKYSTSEQFLQRIMPQVGVISVGENRYGHPAQETLERLARCGCEVYRTDRQGNILIQLRR